MRKMAKWNLGISIFLILPIIVTGQILSDEKDTVYFKSDWPDISKVVSPDPLLFNNTDLSFNVSWGLERTRKIILSENSVIDLPYLDDTEDSFYALKICNEENVYTFSYKGAEIKPMSSKPYVIMSGSPFTCTDVLLKWTVEGQFYWTLGSEFSSL